MKDSGSASLPSKPESGQVADRAVHAVGRNDVLGLDHVAVVQRDLGTVGGLADPGCDVRAVHPAAEFLEAVSKTCSVMFSG